MKTFNYQIAAQEAIKVFDSYRKDNHVKEIAKTDEFRTLKVYESGSSKGNMDYILFGLEFADYSGSNYREVLIAIYRERGTGAILKDLRLYTITSVK